MKRLFGLLIAIPVAIISSFSQNAVTIRLGKTIGPESAIELQYFYKGKFHALSSLKTDGKDSLIVKDFTRPGLYSIALKGYKNQAEFIYNPTENMVIEVDMTLANGQIAIERSKENIVYNDLIKIDQAYNRFLDSVQSVRRELHITTSDFYGRCFFLDSIFEVVASEKNGRLTYLQFSNPGTYTVDVLLPLSLIPISSMEEKRKFQTPDAFISSFFFKYYNRNVNLLQHYALEDATIRFISKYSHPGTDGIKKSIDYVIGTFKADTALSNYVSEFLIKTFLDAKTPEFALYVMGNAGEGCSFDLGEKQTEYLSNYKHVQVGSLVDDIILNDINAMPVSLSNTCKKGELSILLFWTSWCTHCQSFLPELNKILLDYKGKVNVFAVSLDEKEGEWKDFVDKNGLGSWVNVCELKKIEKSNLAPRFMVTHTPSIYLLNKERKIVAKNLNKESIIFELQSRIKK